MLHLPPEPTLEEILASLRAEAAPPPLPGNPVGDDVLELTQEVEQAAPPQPAPLPLEELVLEYVAPPVSAPVLSGEPMVAPSTSLENVFARAVCRNFEPVLNRLLSDNFEGVINRANPLIREWMDEHFPVLLEGAIRAEVERVIRAREATR